MTVEKKHAMILRGRFQNQTICSCPCKPDYVLHSEYVLQGTNKEDLILQAHCLTSLQE